MLLIIVNYSKMAKVINLNPSKEVLISEILTPIDKTITPTLSDPDKASEWNKRNLMIMEVFLTLIEK